MACARVSTLQGALQPFIHFTLNFTQRGARWFPVKMAKQVNAALPLSRPYQNYNQTTEQTKLRVS